MKEINLLDPTEIHEISSKIDQVQKNKAFAAKKVLEALFFASSEPLPSKKIRSILQEDFHLSPRALSTLIKELKTEYDMQGKAFELLELEEGWLLRTRLEYAPYVQKLFYSKRGEKLSAAATEVLAIIAYRQPLTRSQIDAIRGVDSSGSVAGLVERGLISCVGTLEAPGRPRLYATTNEFLNYFGIQALSELPNMNKEQPCSTDSSSAS